MGRLEMLRRVPIFADLDVAALSRLAPLMGERFYPKDSVIVGQDESGEAMFVVLRGKVKVVLYGSSGREVILAIFKPGEFFGEMALLDGQPRSATVIAMEDSTLAVLDRRTFAAHLEQNPQTTLKVLAELSRRLRQADRVIGNLMLLDVYGRVARFLRDLAKAEGKSSEGQTVVRRPTQQQIASMLGTSRETVSRALADFQRNGHLRMIGRQLIIQAEFLADKESAQACR